MTSNEISIERKLKSGYNEIGDEIGKIVKQKTISVIRGQELVGAEWEHLANVTNARKKNRLTLIDTGSLMRSIQYKITTKEPKLTTIEIGVFPESMNIKSGEPVANYARKHEFGVTTKLTKKEKVKMRRILQKEIDKGRVDVVNKLKGLIEKEGTVRIPRRPFLLPASMLSKALIQQELKRIFIGG
jgi:hypothetical protein